MRAAAWIRRACIQIARDVGAHDHRGKHYVELVSANIGNFSSRENAVVLDIGAGEADLSARLACLLNCSCVALDINAEALKRARREHGERVDFVVGDARALPLRKSSVDLVLMISLLEHLTEPEKSIREACGATTVGGFLVIQIPNLFWMIEPHTKWPFLCFMPETVKRMVENSAGYGDLNFDVTPKKVGRELECYHAIPFLRINIYHHRILKTPFWPPSWMIFSKRLSPTTVG